MEPWQFFWCFYNWIALSNATSVELLGTIILVIPAILTLPTDLLPQLGERHTAYIEFRESKTNTLWMGILTVILSVLAIIPYGLVLSQTDGETCKVVVTPAAEIYDYLNALYVFTIFVLLLFGFFYISLQDTRKKYEALTKDIKE